MREILFRGKRLDNDEWVYGLICRVGDKYANIVEKDTEVLYSVSTKTIGQYTGLTDMNGKGIFEGDIVKLLDVAVGVIAQECGAFGVGCRKQIDYDYLASEIAPATGFNNSPMFCYNDNFVSLWELYWNYNGENDEISVVEVIGNIYDNPELLEVTK